MTTGGNDDWRHLDGGARHHDDGSTMAVCVMIKIMLRGRVLQ